jgi:tetratricopeptide (TPR) repeat protein
MVHPAFRFAQGRWLFRTVWALGILEFVALCGWVGVHLWAHYQFRAARTALEKGDFADARAHLRHCLKAWPSDADAHFLAARIERRFGEFKAAEEHLKLYKRVRGITDEFQTEWILLRAQGGEWPQLEQSLWKCVEKNHPQTLEILETLAAGFMREARFTAASVCLNEWLKRDPHNVVALEWHAMTHEYLQRRDEAVKDYRQVLELAPGRWQARLQLARLLIEMRNFSEASKELAILNETHSEQEPVQLAWGQCLFNLGKIDEARKFFFKLSAGQEKQPLAFFYLGKLESDPAEAVKWFRKALAIQPAHLEARYALYASLQQAGRSKEAAVELRVYQSARNDQDQTKILHDMMERDPNNPEHLSKLGGHLLEKLDNPQGLTLLQRALAFDPNYRSAHQALARYYEKNKQPELAAKHREYLRSDKK